ncbi:rCG32620, isoform CRA_e [Rattus norvegicus]|uniref:RCG32620, isoform CRA_e n=1 Tax=Rattus norvegicus TaxID=10116 RepID=A6HJW8_RAT|nr:rCG32620, isoform CRA_e [Rattus norvegicus]
MSEAEVEQLLTGQEDANGCINYEEGTRQSLGPFALLPSPPVLQ